MIGMAWPSQLEPFKDEIDVDRVAKAIKASMAGEKPLMAEKQAAEIAQAFRPEDAGQADRQDDGRCQAEPGRGEAFLAENAKKPGVKTTPSGLQYQVVTEGKGAKPKATDSSA